MGVRPRQRLLGARALRARWVLLGVAGDRARRPLARLQLRHRRRVHLVRLLAELRRARRARVQPRRARRGLYELPVDRAARRSGCCVGISAGAVVARARRRVRARRRCYVAFRPDASARSGRHDRRGPRCRRSCSRASSGFACWTSGGLETQLFTLLVAVALDAVVAAVERAARAAPRRRRARARAMTRPEGLLVAAVLGARRALDRCTRRHAAAPAARSAPRLRSATSCSPPRGSSALWAPWFAWRWWYYGWPFPNTYYVKAAGPWADARSSRREMTEQRPLLRLGLAQADPPALRAAARGRSASSPRAAHAAVRRSALALRAARRGLPRRTRSASAATSWASTASSCRCSSSRRSRSTLGLEWLARPRRPRHARGRRDRARRCARRRVRGHAGRSSRARPRAEQLRAPTTASTRPAFLIVYTEDRADDRPRDGAVLPRRRLQHRRRRRRAAVLSAGCARSTCSASSPSAIAHEEPRIRARAGHTKFGSDALLAEYDPTFVFSCYEIHRTPTQPQLSCAPGSGSRAATSTSRCRSRACEQQRRVLHVPREEGAQLPVPRPRATDRACARPPSRTSARSEPRAAPLAALGRPPVAIASAARAARCLHDGAARSARRRARPAGRSAGHHRARRLDLRSRAAAR